MAERFRPIGDNTITHRDLPQRATFTGDEWHDIQNQIKADIQAQEASRPKNMPEVARGDWTDDSDIARISADLGFASKIDLGAEVIQVTAINEKAAQAKADQAKIANIRDQLVLMQGGKKDNIPAAKTPQSALADGAAS